MIKSDIKLPNGTKITIEGTSEEVAKTIQLIQGNTKLVNSGKTKKRSFRGKKSLNKKGVAGRIRELISEDFFNEPKTIQDVKQTLQQKGHIYPVTSISTPLVRLIRSREIRRIKEGKQWVYVSS